MRSDRSQAIAILALFGVILSAVVGPAHKVAGAGSGNRFTGEKVQLNWRNLERQSDIVTSQLRGKPSAAADLAVPEGAELVALIDSDCVSRGRAGTLSLEVTGDSEAFLDRQAYKWKLSNSRTLEDLTEAAQADPCVVGVTENIEFEVTGEFTNDPRTADQVQLSALDADESYEFFWASKFKVSQDVVIAVLDTGVDYNHQDLSAQMWSSPQGHPGYDFVNSTNTPLDDNGHGTHVAGLAAASSSNMRGISGIMGFHAKIMAVKVMNGAGKGDLATVANGVRYAVTNGAHIINLSVGSLGENALIRDAILEAVAANVTVIMAAGNNSFQLSNTLYFSPASYGIAIDGAMTVGSYDTSTMDRSQFSNYSNTFVEMGAPGTSGSVGLLSTYPDNRYINLSGTSMAAPVAGGVAALVIGFFKTRGVSLNPAIVETVMKHGAKRTTRLANDFVDGNQLNLLQIARYLQNSYVFDGSPGLESE